MAKVQFKKSCPSMQSPTTPFVSVIKNREINQINSNKLHLSSVKIFISRRKPRLSQKDHLQRKEIDVLADISREFRHFTLKESGKLILCLS